MGKMRNGKRISRARTAIRRARRTGVALIVSLAVSGGLAVWMLIQTLSGGSVESVPRAGEQIDASFAGLRDTRGAAVDERALATRYRLVTFGFTACPNVCPLTLMGVHQALEQLGPDAARIVPVFVSVDPARDTPQALLAYVNAFDARIVALTGSPQAVERVAQQYRIFFDKRTLDAKSRSYVVEHTAFVLLVDPQQRIRLAIPSTDPPAEIAARIVRAVRGGGAAGV
jgi:cytochrome oxidase Cu insertion factor (SCO1/SenC/PrrC family)